MILLSITPSGFLDGFYFSLDSINKRLVVIMDNMPLSDPSDVLFDALVIEDDPDSRNLLGRVLEHAQVRAVLVETAQEALKLLENFIPDVLIIDLALPTMTGIEFLEVVRQNPDLRHIPAVAVTAYSQKANFSQEQATLIGFEGYL